MNPEKLVTLDIILKTSKIMTQALWNELFDYIYVVSLPSSTDRRTYVINHLRENGIHEFHWHDAYDENHPLVKQAFEQGSVHQYPPCFRCGKTECGQEDCNNVLLPVQVAVFVTYLELLKKISGNNARVLVLEDDVRLHESWRVILPELKKARSSGLVPFEANTPCLLRLGWALGIDHDKPGPVRFTKDIRMSNPCFAVTSAYASKAVSSFKQIDHTADVYFHKQLPNAEEAFTIFPPMASELSWSTGEVASLIHPKEVHVNFLGSSGKHVEAEAERLRIRSHIKHMYHRRFLITGHPRTGTGYAANLFNQLGFDIGHESSGRDGLSSWMFASDAEKYPYAQDTVAQSRKSLHWDFLFHIVRDPIDAIPSIMRDNEWAPVSYHFRRTQIFKQTGIELDSFESNFERAVISLVEWSKMILGMKPDFWFRLENAHEALPAFLLSRGLIESTDAVNLSTVPVNADKLYQGIKRPKPYIEDCAWESLSLKSKDGLRWYCERFGYNLPGTLSHRKSADKAPTLEAMLPLGKLFLTPSGWERSRLEKRPVRKDGRALPWFTYGAIEFLNRIVNGGMRIFEYGAGYSTLWWQRAALVHSVDHDPDWVSELLPMLDKNVTLSLIEQGAKAPDYSQHTLERFKRRPRRTTWDYPPDKVVRRGLEDEGFLAYAAKVQESGLKYDVIIIDGMARRLCAEFSQNCLSETGIIVFDNSNRSDYDVAYEILEEAGFFQIPFWGLVPGASFMTCTSIFAKSLDVLPSARFKPNSFGLPEY